MVAHERVAHEIRVQEPEHREQRAGEKERRRRRAASNAPAHQPKSPQHAGRCARVEPLRGRACAELPPRIQEAQVGRPQQFACVKPQRLPCNQAALGEGNRPFRSFGAHGGLFQPGREQTKAEGNRKERQARQHIRLPADAPAFPPANQQEHCRQ